LDAGSGWITETCIASAVGDADAIEDGFVSISGDGWPDGCTRAIRFPNGAAPIITGWLDDGGCEIGRA
jgi:hypothetical protein